MLFLKGITDAEDAGAHIVEQSTPSIGRWVTFIHTPWVELNRYTTLLLNALTVIDQNATWLIQKKIIDPFVAEQTKLEILARFESQIGVTSIVNGTLKDDLSFLFS